MFLTWSGLRERFSAIPLAFDDDDDDDDADDGKSPPDSQLQKHRVKVTFSDLVCD